MNPTVKRLLELLHDERMERRCAAALVLGALEIRDAAVVRALGEALREENRVLRLYSLEALADLEATGIAEHVLPLLDSQDEEVRRRAQEVLERQGPQAAKLMARELATAPLARRKALVTVLVRNRTPDSLDKLFLTLRDPDVAEHTLAAIRSEMDRANARDRGVMARKATLLLRNKALRGDPFGTANALRLLGYVGDPTSIAVLSSYLVDKLPIAVRAAAVAALRRPLAAKRADAVVAKLLQLADDADPVLARAALDTLRGIDMGPNMAAALLKLCEGRQPEARTFAAERLGTMDTPAAARKLFDTLRKGEPAARDAAARSLMKLGSAIRLLSAAVVREEQLDALATYARALRAHGARVPPSQRAAIAGRLAKLIERKPEDSRVAVLVDLLGALDAVLRDKTLIALALRLKDKGRLADAQSILRPLSRSDSLDAEARFALAVVGLKLGPRDLSRVQRANDPVLGHFGALLDKGFPLLQRIKKERSLDAEHLYYLGFCFAENDSEEQRHFGVDLLKHLADKSPSSKLGRAAKNKIDLIVAAA